MRSVMKNVAIKENHLYQKAYRKGERFVGQCVSEYVLRDFASKRLMKAHPQKQYVNRLGLSISKKLGSAVERNRAKRIMRAAYREIEGQLKTGFLVVISARSGVLGKKTQDVSRELTLAFKKLNMLAPQKEIPAAAEQTNTQAP